LSQTIEHICHHGFNCGPATGSSAGREEAAIVSSNDFKSVALLRERAEQAITRDFDAISIEGADPQWHDRLRDILNRWVPRQHLGALRDPAVDADP
jgi:hypothetical protein